MSYSRITTVLMAALLGPVCVAQGEPLSVSESQVLQSVAAAARVYLGLPEMERLPEEDLQPLLTAWDERIGSPDVRVRSEALDLVSRGAALRYDNPEIVSCLTDLYVNERDDYARRVEQGLSFEEAGLIAPGESHLDYMDGLIGLALQTFSPEIYDVVISWHGLDGGRLRDLYLAAVNPDTTLDLLLETELRKDQRASPRGDILDHPSGKACFGTLLDALEVIALMCEVSPDSVIARREEVLAFVEQHAKHYSTLVVKRDQKPGYFGPRDYRARVLALQTLQCLAASSDIYDVVSDIMKDPPKNPSGSEANAITRMGEKLIEQIRAIQ